MRPGPTTPEWWRLAFRSWKRPANGKPPPRAGSLFMKRVPVPLWHGAGPRPHARKPHEGLGPGWWLAQRETVGEASHLPAVLASPTAGRRALCRQRPCGPWRGAPPRSNPTPGQRPPSRVPRSQSIPGDAAQILCATSQNQDGCRAGPSGPPRSPAGSNPPEESNPQVKPPARNIRGGLTWGLPNRPGGPTPPARVSPSLRSGRPPVSSKLRVPTNTGARLLLRTRLGARPCYPHFCSWNPTDLAAELLILGLFFLAQIANLKWSISRRLGLAIGFVHELFLLP